MSGRDHDTRPYAKRRNAIMTDPRARDWHCMSLEQIQAELRAISGTPYRKNENPVRRRKLWRRLDYLIRLRHAQQTSNNGEGDPSDEQLRPISADSAEAGSPVTIAAIKDTIAAAKSDKLPDLKAPTAIHEHNADDEREEDDGAPARPLSKAIDAQKLAHFNVLAAGLYGFEPEQLFVGTNLWPSHLRKVASYLMRLAAVIEGPVIEHDGEAMGGGHG
jgi:hypothetical protein